MALCGVCRGAQGIQPVFGGSRSLLPDRFADEVNVEAILWHPTVSREFLGRVYGVDAEVHSPGTELTRVHATIRKAGNAHAAI